MKDSTVKGNRWLMFTYKGRPRIVTHYRWSGEFLRCTQIGGMADTGKMGPKNFKLENIENMVEFSVMANEDGLVRILQSTPYTKPSDK